MTSEERNELTGRIILACIKVHKELGPGLLESVYEACLMEEFATHHIRARNQVDLPVYYRGKILNKMFKVDVLVEEEIILELKSVEAILPVHEEQLLTYLKLCVENGYYQKLHYR
jgi:GxxExxY protein